MTFRLVLGRDPEHITSSASRSGTAQRRHLRALRAILLGPALGELSWQLAVYAALSLTLVRMLPVAIAMLGSRARAQTLGFLGWFGPAVWHRSCSR